MDQIYSSHRLVHMDCGQIDQYDINSFIEMTNMQTWKVPLS